VRASVLGPLLLQRGSEDFTPSAPKLRKVLALLLLNADTVVPAASLIRELWHDRPPSSAQTTLQTYVLQLRRLIGGNHGKDTSRKPGRDVLTTEVGGYRLRMQPGELDVQEYKLLVSDGRRAFAESRWQTAAEVLARAQALWRGPALVDVEAGQLLRPLIVGLDESYVTTIEQSIEANLRLGRHLEILSDLTALVAEHRFHENLHGLLMLALHRCGRRNDALMVFHRLRTRLVAELGFEPSKPLHLLQGAILSDDPALREFSIFGRPGYLLSP
jgi:DNA-binding SARP family transcriptional activator